MADRLLSRDTVTGQISAGIDPNTLGGFGYSSVVASGTLPAANTVVNVDTTAIAPGVLTLTLPAPVIGRTYIIRKVNGPATGTISLARFAGEQIDGVAATRVMEGGDNVVDPTGFGEPYTVWMVWCDGTNWFTFSTAPQSRLSWLRSAPPVDTVNGLPSGYYPGSFWHEAVGDSGRLYVQTGADAGDGWWVRLDATDAESLTTNTVLTNKDKSLFVDTTGGVVTLTLPDPTAQGLGRKFVITKTNTGTNKITLARDAAENINGVAASFDLPGSATAARGRWLVISDGTDWWVTINPFTVSIASVTDLQTAYDGGADITLSANGAVDVNDAVANADGYVMAVTAAAGGAIKDALQVTRNPGVANTAGDAVSITLSSNAVGSGVNVQHSGSGRPAQFAGLGATSQGSSFTLPFGNASNAVEVDHSGTGAAIKVSSFGGPGLLVDFAAGGGPAAIDVNVGFSTPALGLDIDQAGNAGAAQIVVSNGFSAGIATAIEHQGTGIVLDLNAAGGSNVLINAHTNTTNILSVDPALVTVGEPATPVTIIGHSVVRMGTASGTTVKGFDAYTTNVGSDPVDVANLGRLLMRPGTNTAPATTADLALRAGSEGETLLTKGGRLYANAVIREFVIESGVTLALGDVVSPALLTGRVGKADATTASNRNNAIGIVLVGGTGDGGGTVRALVAIGGYVEGLTGLTANTPVYLSATTPGVLTSTVPAGSGKTSIRIGFALTQSSIIIHVGEKVDIP
jgi:hypothetical protein